MQISKHIRIITAAALMLIAVAVLSSCASTNRTDVDIPLEEITHDICSESEQPIEEPREYSEDVVITIEKKDAEGRANTDDDTDEPADDETAGNNDEQSSENEYDTGHRNEHWSINDDETADDIGFEGTYTETEEETEEPVGTTPDAPLYNPDYMEIDANSETFKLYDVPLQEFKQKYVIETAQRFKIPPELIFAVMHVETRYTETAISKNGKYIGIMQIAKSNLKTLTKKFGTTDLQDFLQNVEAGAYFLSYFYKKYDGNIDKVCMCYHYGEGGANVQWRNGNTQDGYCRKVRAEMERIFAAE